MTKIKRIAHRGNLYGPNSVLENHPSAIEDALQLGYDVEVDIWYFPSDPQKLHLGHDGPEYVVSLPISDIWQTRIWWHAKNPAAMTFALSQGWHVFWHETDRMTLTSKQWIWNYPHPHVSWASSAHSQVQSVIVLPELYSHPFFPSKEEEEEEENHDSKSEINTSNKAICTDYCYSYQSFFENHVRSKLLNSWTLSSLDINPMKPILAGQPEPTCQAVYSFLSAFSGPGIHPLFAALQSDLAFELNLHHHIHYHFRDQPMENSSDVYDSSLDRFGYFHVTWFQYQTFGQGQPLSEETKHRRDDMIRTQIQHSPFARDDTISRVKIHWQGIALTPAGLIMLGLPHDDLFGHHSKNEPAIQVWRKKCRQELQSDPEFQFSEPYKPNLIHVTIFRFSALALPNSDMANSVLETCKQLVTKYQKASFGVSEFTLDDILFGTCTCLQT